MTTVRLAKSAFSGWPWTPWGGRKSAEREKNSPTVRLAHVIGAQGDNVLQGQRGVEKIPHESRPALLVSYAYLRSWEQKKHLLAYRDWALDSGAFTAHASGKPVDLQAYIECCQRLLAEDPTLVEVYALDVIGDWRASLANAEAMWAAGIEAVPCFHFGEPEDALLGLARDYPKIALGGVARMRERKRIEWARQCFARVWPKKIHGFGMSSDRCVLTLPFHSVDASSWELAPCGFGHWRTYGKMSVRGSDQNLRVEIESYLALERRARHLWRHEMKKLAAGEAPNIVRLSHANSHEGRKKRK